MIRRHVAPWVLTLLVAGAALSAQQPSSQPPANQEPPASAPAPPPAQPPAAATGEPPIAGPPPATAPSTPPGAPAGRAPGEPAAPAPAAAPTPAANPAADQSGQEPGATVLERFLSLDVFFPEGEIDLRLSRLVNKVFFDGLIRYNVVSGDIIAFLRYRYYGYKTTTQVALFDQISLERLQNFSNEFDRTRGLLVFMEFPHSYDYRTFLLTEIDRISSNRKEQLITNNFIDTFVRLGLQIGSPGDERSQAIVGENRARTPSLFTAVRDIGPNDFSFTTAVTYGFPYLAGDFNYLRLEFEALKRFDIAEKSLVVGRLHGGSFPYREESMPNAPILTDRFQIPLAAFFTLGGIDDMKGVSSNLMGTEELYTTWEYYTPWFLGANRHFLQVDWQNWYWVGYTGLGTIGFDRNVYTQFRQYIPDVGIGFESSARVSKYRFFLSGIVARALKAGAGKLEARLSIKSYR
jgi:hypothetical protein